jgi:hypothetical protein
MRCMISQPTFLPWLGWFDLADQVDALILLDDVQFEKRSWQQRNRIRTAKGLEFITVPVATAGRFSQTICEVALADPVFGDHLLRTLSANYARAPFFVPVITELEEIIPTSLANGLLVDLNEALIGFLARWLGISTPTQRASTLGVAGKRGEHLALLCQTKGAVDYLSTAGAENSLRADHARFTSRGIAIWLHEYLHPEYPQLYSPFLPYASALDLVMMTGYSAGDIMRNSSRILRPLSSHV